MEKVIIVGGVAAGATAAAKVRRLSSDAEITILEAGPDISFANCGLPYYIGGDIDSRSKLILQSPESFNSQYNVNVRTLTEVTAIDKENKTVTILNKENNATSKLPYTKLILAQGGKPIQPDLSGADLSHVFSLWTLSDMDNIYNYIEEKEPKTAVVVGGGFIGLEMVEALTKRDIKVKVVEMMPHVMSMMDGETAGFVETEMKSYGVEIHTNTAVKKIKSGKVYLDNGKKLSADIVLLSIGVRPTLALAQATGLEIGESGGLLVDEYLQTSNKNIYAAGDMVEIPHKINGKKVRIPLAGPANRQGRIAAENALGGKHKYAGALGTSIVRVFEAVVGITGLSLKQALKLGYNASSIVLHKEHHTSYYPGAKNVSVMLVFDKETGVILGGQTAGYKGADRRLDVIATAATANMTVHELADIDFAYSPPLGTANDAINMAAFTAENQISNYSPSITAVELDDFILQHSEQLIILDLRDMFAFEKSHIHGATNLPLEYLTQNLDKIPKDATILVYDEYGKKGHQALRTLKGYGIQSVYNLSGGHTSLQRYEQAIGFKNCQLPLLPIEEKSIHKQKEAQPTTNEANEGIKKDDSPMVIDVRTPMEFQGGAYPDAINIPLDSLPSRLDELGDKMDREITVYCASGARSSYAQSILRQKGYTNVTNGGGLMQMMMRK